MQNIKGAISSEEKSGKLRAEVNPRNKTAGKFDPAALFNIGYGL